MRVLVCGSRTFWDSSMIRQALVAVINEHEDNGESREDITLVHGDCQGADRLAEDVALELGITNIERHPADWDRHGKAAGPIRNAQMVDSLDGTDKILAFWDGKSKGTQHTIKYARSRLFDPKIYYLDEE